MIALNKIRGVVIMMFLKPSLLLGTFVSSCSSLWPFGAISHCPAPVLWASCVIFKFQGSMALRGSIISGGWVENTSPSLNAISL